MPLSDDQRKLLRLLANQDEAYEAIAAATGASVEDLKTRARLAIEELDRDAVDDARRPAGPVAAGDPPSPAVAEASSGRVPPATPPAGEAARKPRPARPRSRGPVRLPGNRRLAELVGGAVVVLLLILFATGAIDIGGDSDSDNGAGSTGTTEVAEGSDQLTQAVLEPVGGSEASGRALFGRVGENPVLQVQAEGLEPSGRGESYTVWLYRSPKLALRVGAARVGKDGGLAAQLPIPVELLGFVANGAFTEIRISLVENAAYKADVARAKRQNRLPRYSGATVLRGEISGPAATTEQGG